MRRRVFITGSLLAGAAAATSLWRARLGWHAGAGPASDAERLPDGRVLVRDAALAFGTTVSMAVVHDDPGVARAAVAEALAAVRRIDALMTVYRPESQVGRLNADGELGRPDPRARTAPST
jgi:thiamine biosynthesis lipoprotein